MSSWDLLFNGCMFSNSLYVCVQPGMVVSSSLLAILSVVLSTGLCNDAYVRGVAAHLLGEGVR